MSKGDGKTIIIDGKSISGRGSLFWSGVFLLVIFLEVLREAV